MERIAGVRGPCALVFGAEADGLTDEQAHALAKEGKAVVWIDGGIHANDSAPADFIRENLLIQTHVIDAANSAVAVSYFPRCRSIKPNATASARNDGGHDSSIIFSLRSPPVPPLDLPMQPCWRAGRKFSRCARSSFSLSIVVLFISRALGIL